jgi:hypothetical protein
VKAPTTGRNWFDGAPVGFAALPCREREAAAPQELSGRAGSRFLLHLCTRQDETGSVTLLYLQCDSRMRRRGVGTGAAMGESLPRFWTRELDFAAAEGDKEAGCELIGHYIQW